MGEVLVWRKLDESQFSNNRDHFCGKLVCERLINNNEHSFPFRFQYIFIQPKSNRCQSLNTRVEFCSNCWIGQSCYMNFEWSCQNLYMNFSIGSDTDLSKLIHGFL